MVGGIVMNTSEFLKSYKEIENLIRENLEEIYQAYNVSKKYGVDYFFIDWNDEFCIKFFSREDYKREDYKCDYDFIHIPLEWFESDDVLKSNLAEIINKKRNRK